MLQVREIDKCNGLSSNIWTDGDRMSPENALCGDARRDETGDGVGKPTSRDDSALVGAKKLGLALIMESVGHLFASISFDKSCTRLRRTRTMINVGMIP